MNLADRTIDTLASASADYGPKMTDGALHLSELNLFIDIRQNQAMAAGSMAVFISEITASTQKGQPGITITCVGSAQDLPSAAADAAAQWGLGVLPVLAEWRGRHTCLTSALDVETQRGPFVLRMGPLIARGRPETGGGLGASSLASPLLPLLHKARPAQRLHWLEIFACKFADGAVDATCRLNNHDWLSGKKALAALAAGWPGSTEPMQTSRTFALFMPQAGTWQEIVQPTFWSRLLGQA